MNAAYSDVIDQVDTGRTAESLLLASRYFHRLGRRWQVALCQLPLTVAAAAVAASAPALHPALLQDRLFQSGLLLQAVLIGLCLCLPWDRLPHGSLLVVPVLDFLAIGLARTGAADALPGLGVLAVFPVIWLSASGLYPLFGLLMSFLGPLAIVLVPLLGRIPAMAASELAATLMLPLMMLTVAFAIRFASGTMTLQQHQLEEKDRELRALLAKSSKRERLLNTILETVDVGLVAVDASGHQILKNRQQQLFHQLANPAEKPDPDESQLQVFGQDRTTPLPPQRRPIRRAANGETFSDALVWLGEGPAQRAVSVAARAMREGNGKFSGSVVVFSDVTELVEAISAKEEFISHVAHELSTPLTSILSYLDLVLDTDQELPDHAGTYLKVVRRNAERLVSLVSDLLAAASSAMNIHPRPTDLATLVEASIETFLTQAKRAGIGLVRDMPDPLWTYADPVRIGQVLDNLLSNAIKYSPGGGCVTIRAREHGDCVELQVADTGMGMTEAEAAQAFSKFFRTSAARRSAAPGVGLGLSITKAIVEGHGGTISCASRPGAGTTFTVVLPARPAAAPHPVPGTDPSAAAPNPAAGAR